MLQRAMDPDDPAAGTWEFPGGGIEDGETPEQGAAREWCEETGMTLPGEHAVTGSWDSANGVYRGFVISVEHEADLELNPDHEDRAIANPDDPNGDATEVTAWFRPEDLPGMPSLRPEVENTPWELLGASSDPSVDDGSQPAMTAAQEADVTAPPAPPAGAPTATPPASPGATGGDTPAPGADLTPGPITWSGPIADLDTPSSDGRMIASEGLIVRPLPLPLSWQRESGPEHDDSVIVGRVLAVEIRGGQLWGSGDWLDPMTNFDVEQAMAQVDAGLGMVSVDLAPLAVGLAGPDGTPIDPVLWDGDEMDIVTNYLASEFGGCTIVSFQAFPDARISLDVSAVEPDAAVPDVAPLPMLDSPGTFATEGTPPVTTPAATDDTSSGGGATLDPDGKSITLGDGSTVAVGDAVCYPDPDGDVPWETGSITNIDPDAATVSTTPETTTSDPSGGDDPPRVGIAIDSLMPKSTADGVPGTPDGDASAGASLLASSEVRPYTSAHFAKRELDGPTPLTVNPETGEVFGHLATWGECHVGKMAQMGQCVTAPHSKTDYGYFHLSPVLTDEGPLDVGKITVGTGHANPRGGFANAVQHYDNSGTAVAVVRAHEDAFGIQVAGQLIHDTPPARVEELMRSPLSGDWRGMNGNLELTAALAVNVPGFPVRRPTPVTGMARDSRVGQLSLVAAGVVDHVAEVTLPSGTKIKAADMEALVAAASQVIERGRVPRVSSEAQAKAVESARLRLARGRFSSLTSAGARQ